MGGNQIEVPNVHWIPSELQEIGLSLAMIFEWKVPLLNGFFKASHFNQGLQNFFQNDVGNYFKLLLERPPVFLLFNWREHRALRISYTLSSFKFSNDLPFIWLWKSSLITLQIISSLKHQYDVPAHHWCREISPILRINSNKASE